MRVLVVEDEKRIADFLTRGLQGAGYAVDTAPDGATAVEFIHSTDYDLVILDLMLPDMDGLKVLERIHQSIMFARHCRRPLPRLQWPEFALRRLRESLPKSAASIFRKSLAAAPVGRSPMPTSSSISARSSLAGKEAGARARS